MGVTWSLCCLDCGDGVLLGKPVKGGGPGPGPGTLGFETLGRQGDEGWAPAAEGAANLAHFLMLHRCHELRVLPETAGALATREEFPTAWPDQPGDPDPAHDRTRFLARDPGRPDPVAETAALPERVKARIAEF